MIRSTVSATATEVPNWADQSIAYGTWALVLVTAALFVATFFLWRAAVSTLVQSRADARAALKQTKDLFAAERRPWIQIRAEPNGQIVENEGGVAVPLKIVLRNVGLGPAAHVQVRFEENRALDEGPDVPSLRAAIESARSEPIANLGASLFPNEDVTYDRKNALMQTAKARDGIFVRGFVAYQFPGFEGWHFTPFVWVAAFKRDADSKRIYEWSLGPHFESLPPE